MLLAWWLMYRGAVLPGGPGLEGLGAWEQGPDALGLPGFAYASAVAFTGQSLTLYMVVFAWKKLHADVWFGWQPRRVFHGGLNRRFIQLALPMMLQYALNSWTSTMFQLFMQQRDNVAKAHGQKAELAAAYGVCFIASVAQFIEPTKCTLYRSHVDIYFHSGISVECAFHGGFDARGQHARGR